MERLTLEEAKGLLLQRIKRIEETEEIALWEADKRVLAEDVIAGQNQPPFPRAPLDGYAVNSRELAGASREQPVELQVIDEVAAGSVSTKAVKGRTAVRIMTGAPIPAGADCVIRQEDTDQGEKTVQLYRELRPYENYCFAGEDYQKGSLLLKKGTLLRTPEIGLLASLGQERISVLKKPSVALITTGDELLLPGEPLQEGKIYDANLYMLRNRLLSWGMEVSCQERARDEVKETAELIREKAKAADLIVTTGGVSVGKKDIMHEVLDALGCERLFWKIAVKPGMPTLCGQYGSKLLLCLSGNPYGALANLELLVRPVLAVLAGRRDLELQRKTAVLEGDYLKESQTVRYVGAYYENGRVWVPEGLHSSGILSTLCGCNCMLEIPAGTKAFHKGDTVCVVMTEL